MQVDFSLAHLICQEKSDCIICCFPAVFLRGYISMAQFLSSNLIYATLILFSCHQVSSLMSSYNNETDRLALLSFKSVLSSGDPRGPLSSWNDSVQFCQWPGITCGGRQHRQRVISLDLRSLNLDGSISSAMANLTFLRKIDMSDNRIHGPIPEGIGGLLQLQYLNLSVNSLEEGIPASLSYCSNLQEIRLDHNMLQGEIPASISSCLDLRIISLGNNKLTGNIPLSLTNLSSLSVLSVSNNRFSGGVPDSIGNLYSLIALDLSENQLSGVVPPSLGRLLKLTGLDLSGNHLSGEIPMSLWNLSSLSHLSMANNNLSGLLPYNLGNALPLLERAYLYNNQFHGPIPSSLSNASRLEIIDLSANRLVGTIPANLGSLQNLRWLNVANNQLEVREPDGWSFLAALTNCTNLEKLQLEWNTLGSILPSSIAKFSSKLQKLTMSGNEISGSIPPAIGNLVSLTTLDLGSNLLVGPIPSSIGTLKLLHVLDLGFNRLSGELPSSLGNLTQLNLLRLGSNELSGSIPPTLGYCQHLTLLDLSFNKLTGGIPTEILTISTLSIHLDLAHNSLTGSIPSEVGNLINLGKMDFSMNNLSGELPSSLGNCQELGKLYLHGNFFDGNISFMSRLRGIQELDVSRNNFSGQIPNEVQEFRFLYHINLSFNNFEGDIPQRGVFMNQSAVSIIGNTKLCGGGPLLQLPPCPFQSTVKKHRFPTFTVIFAFFCTWTCLFLLVYLTEEPRRKSIIRMLGYRCGRESEGESIVEAPRYEPMVRIPRYKLGRISYAELARATNEFSTDNIIGAGGSGAVYKGIMKYDGTSEIFTFAVKVLNLQQRGSSKIFITESEMLRNISHRNIVRMYTTCSSIDSMGNDFKAIVFEFMTNGNLDNWLHPIADEQPMRQRLNFMQRINIAIGVATALDYLHHNDRKPIVHCDIKPSNILLDDKMNAHVGDFGLARVPVETLVRSSLRTTTTNVACRGTVGYVAPEYGTANRVSTKGDVYSYGMLLLEMFTGKAPTDDTFRSGINLKKYVKMALPELVLDIVDASLLSSEVNEASDDAQSLADCLSSLLRIGLSCSTELPAMRPEIREITWPLQTIRNRAAKLGMKGDQPGPSDCG